MFFATLCPWFLSLLGLGRQAMAPGFLSGQGGVKAEADTSGKLHMCNEINYFTISKICLSFKIAKVYISTKRSLHEHLSTTPYPIAPLNA